MKPAQMPLPPADLSGGKQPTILLFGNSHSHAVHRAVEMRLGQGRSAPLAVFRQLKEKNGRKIGNITFDGFLDRISQLGPNDVVLSMIGGNQHAVFSTVQHPQPFDFYTPDHGAAPRDGVEIIPYRALIALFAKGVIEGLAIDNVIIQGVGRGLEAVRNATGARVVHLIPPPPKGDKEYIVRHHEKLFAGQGIASLGVSPPELRLKFWLLQARILQKFCRKLGIEVMMPPAQAMRDGFLRPEHYGDDATHANWLYGELVLRSVEARFLLNEPAAG